MSRQSQEDYIDLKQILSRFLSKWYWFAISLGLCVVLALFYIKTSPEIYKVSSVIKMKTGVTKAEKILDPVETREKNVNIEDEILVIKSTNYIREALSKLDFTVAYFTQGMFSHTERYKYDYPVKVKVDTTKNQITNIPIHIDILSDKEFELSINGKNAVLYNFLENSSEPLKDISFKKRYQFGEEINEEMLGINISLVGNPAMYGSEDLYFTINNPGSLVKKYFGKLNVEVAGRESNILLLSTEGNVVSKEKAFLDTLMFVVMQKDLDNKNIAGLKTIEFINYQLADVSQSLNEAEQDLESFQYSTTNIGESSALYQRRDQNEAELANLNVKLSYFRNILNNIESLESVSKISSPSSVGVTDPILSNLLVKLTELSQQRIQLGRTATEANPVIQRIDLDIKTTKKALSDNLNGAINTTNLQINDVQSRIGQVNQMINRLPSASIRKLGIQRRFDFTDNTYELFQERKAAAAIALATNESDWSIVEQGRMEGTGPVSPKVKFILLLALFLGFVIPAVTLILMDYFDNSIKGKSDLERLSSIPIIGSIAKGNKHQKLASDYDSRSLLLESLRDIRLNLQFFSSNKEMKVIGCTSSTSGEGKTFSAVNLAVVLAQAGKRVALIDADLRKSDMSSFFEIPNNIGLSTYLIGNSNIKDVIKNTRVKNLDVILSGPFPPNPFDLLGLSRFDNLIDELKNEYDHVIIDSSPLGLVSDYLLLTKFTDINIYIARSGVTKKKYFDKINEIYSSGKISHLGIVMNEVKMSRIYGGLSKTPYGGEENSDKGTMMRKKRKIATAQS